MHQFAAMPQRLENEAISPSSPVATAVTEWPRSSSIRAIRPASRLGELASSRPAGCPRSSASVSPPQLSVPDWQRCSLEFPAAHTTIILSLWPDWASAARLCHGPDAIGLGTAPPAEPSEATPERLPRTISTLAGRRRDGAWGAHHAPGCPDNGPQTGSLLVSSLEIRSHRHARLTSQRAIISTNFWSTGFQGQVATRKAR